MGKSKSGDEAKNRRRFRRRAVRYRVAVRDAFARVAATGYTENISDGGLLLICKNHQYVPRKGKLFVAVMDAEAEAGTNSVQRYACQIIHVANRENDELALGVQFVDRPV